VWVRKEHDMNINKRVGRALKLLIVCVCLQGVASCSSGAIIIRALPPELTISEVVDNA
jgi:hypothetical protein